MPHRRISLVLCIFFVALEVGLFAWRQLATPVSNAPFFVWPAAAGRFDQSPDLAPAVAAYNADRGAEIKFDGNGGSSLTAFYFEWDNVEVGPLMNLGGHSPDECNLALGYKLLAIEENKNFVVSGQPPLVFDCTKFEDLNGGTVYIYKMAWIQGIGSWQLRVGKHRFERISRSFIRHSGAGRVVQAGVFGAIDENEAWNLFEQKVLKELIWKFPSN